MKTAFTLAEVLITLGIIGIVAAMTIPNLISTHQKKATVTKLQKAISVINQAYRLSFDDVGEPESAFDIGAEEYFKTYWAPYLKVATYCNSYSDCGYKSSRPYSTANGAVPDITLPASTSANASRTLFAIPDGTFFMIFTASGDGKGGISKDNRVLVDLNGGEKPNIFGRDVFMLERFTDGVGVQPKGYKESNTVVNQRCISYGWENTCAEKIRRAGWQIDKSYPWKGAK